MTTLILRDLSDAKALDTTSMNEIKGGIYYQPSYPLFGGISSAGDGVLQRDTGPDPPAKQMKAPVRPRPQWNAGDGEGIAKDMQEAAEAEPK